MKKTFLKLVDPYAQSHLYFMSAGDIRRSNMRVSRTRQHRSDGHKIQIKTDGLEGDALEFTNKLNAKLNELPAMISVKDLEDAIAAIKIPDGLAKETEVNTKIEGLKTIIAAQGVDIEAMKAAGAGAKKDMSLRGQIKAWLETDKVKAAIAAIKGGSQTGLPEFEIDLQEAAKVAATMTFATVDAGGSAYIPQPDFVPGVIDLVRAQPTFWDRLIKGSTSRAAIVWVNKVNKQGNAAFIGEGVLKPLASFELATEISNAKKVAERMKASTEILEDIEGFATLIENELKYEVRVAVNTALLTATASATSPGGIIPASSAFSLTTLSVVNPNNFDAVRAAVAQLRSLNFNGNVVAFMNPIDVVNMELTKAEDSGVYMLPPFTSANGTRIAGVDIVEDPAIPVGNLLVADLTKFKVLIYKNLTITWGWENDDFSKNLVTVIGEMRLHQYVSSNHTGAFVYDSLEDIKGAIEAGS